MVKKCTWKEQIIAKSPNSIWLTASALGFNQNTVYNSIGLYSLKHSLNNLLNCYLFLHANALYI